MIVLCSLLISCWLINENFHLLCDKLVFPAVIGFWAIHTPPSRIHSVKEGCIAFLAALPTSCLFKETHGRKLRCWNTDSISFRVYLRYIRVQGCLSSFSNLQDLKLYTRVTTEFTELVQNERKINHISVLTVFTESLKQLFSLFSYKTLWLWTSQLTSEAIRKTNFNVL